MGGTKIRLSEEEMELITRTDWILTKNRLMAKVRDLLLSLADDQQGLMQSYGDRLPPEAFAIPYKISKGENYHGLPYLVLDQPRYFNRDDVFAIRTMFWWGNFFSVTLHLAGVFRSRFDEKIGAAFEELQSAGFYIGHTDPWEHHFGADNYISMQSLKRADYEELAGSTSFLKIAAQVPLSKWDDAEKEMLEIFSRLLKVLTV